MVYVIDKTGNPLMPTENCRMVRLLLRAQKACVVKNEPFTIRLKIPTHIYKQDVTLALDAGSKHVGVSATTEKKELFSGELRPRNDVTDNLSTRRELRGSRRYRTTPYRPARFNNRVRSKHKGWLAPSVEVKINNHLQAIRLVSRILPITKIRVETAEFDLQRLKAMEAGRSLPVGADYQLGEQYDFYNVRQYVLHRDGYACRQCGAHSTPKKSVKFHVHHLETRKTGGDAPDNLVTLCEACHKAYHDGVVELKVEGRRRKSTRDAAFMGIMRKTLMERIRAEFSRVDVQETYGYITKCWRERLGLPKSHVNDAFVISRNFDAVRCEDFFLMIPKRRHNRQLHKANPKKGTRQRNQAPRKIFGWQLYDKVKCLGRTGFVFGRRSKGGFDIRSLGGEKINPNISRKKLRLVERRHSVLVQRMPMAASTQRLKAWVSAAQ